jgi:hypothetical protein
MALLRRSACCYFSSRIPVSHTYLTATDQPDAFQVQAAWFLQGQQALKVALVVAVEEAGRKDK